MSLHDMVLTLVLATAHYTQEKAKDLKIDVGPEKIEVEAVINGEFIRDIILVEDPKFVTRSH